MPTDRPDPPVPYVDQAPALTNVAFAHGVVGHSLEGLFVYLDEDGAHLLRPIHAAALRVGWDPERQPGDILVAAARRYGLVPMLVHSTSWRIEQARVILTYLVAVEPPSARNGFLADDPVVRAQLARGDAMAPPPSIDTGQVIEHAFRHLAWLVRDDAAVHDALPAWTRYLEGYEPEPFRAFGPG